MTCHRFIRTGLPAGVIILIAAAVTALLPSPAHAVAPARIGHLVDEAILSERDRDDIRRYAKHWAEQLAEPAKPAEARSQEVDEARSKLIEPLKAVRVGQPFRSEYSKALVPHLKAVIQKGSTHAAVNSLQIVALLGTPDALKVILAHASRVGREGREGEDDFGIRLWAAIAFPIAVEQGVLSQNKINEALRQLEKAAGHEAAAAGADDAQYLWLVLQRQFEAIASVKSPVSRDVQVKVLKAVTKAMADQQQGPSDLMQATYPALMLILNEYLTLDSANRERIGKSLAPVLCNLCKVAAEHWGEAQDDHAARKSYGGAVHISENLLKLIDARVRPNQVRPRTALGPAWRNGDKNRFDRDRDKWNAVLRGPPYVDTR